MSIQLRFDFARFSTREKAEQKLEDYYATGEVSDADQPEIEPRRKTRSGPFHYVITLNG
jgi:hypothetical protein